MGDVGVKVDSDPSFGPQFRSFGPIPVSGATSLFDVKSVFKGKSWLCFEIPEGTVIPASLVVRETGYNPRLVISNGREQTR